MVDYAKITELFQQDAFQQEANICKTMEDFHNLFIRNGVEISEAETVELISKIAEQKQKMDNGEIAETDLENVAGGFALTGFAAVAACVGIGALCIGTACVTGFVAYQGMRWANKHKH